MYIILLLFIVPYLYQLGVIILTRRCYLALDFGSQSYGYDQC